MLESRIEAQSRIALFTQGAIAHKLTGQAGDPDRVVIWHDGIAARVFYLEMKTPVGRLSKIQILRHQQLAAPVYVCRSAKGALLALETERSKYVSV